MKRNCQNNRNKNMHTYVSTYIELLKDVERTQKKNQFNLVR